MAQLNISVAKGRFLSDVPIAVEVVNRELETEWKQAIKLGHSALVQDLPAKQYSIQARLPSGHIVSRGYDLKEGETGEVVLDVTSASPREWLEWTTISKPRSLASFELHEARLRSVWLRLWGRDASGKWQVRPWPVQKPARERGLVQYEFSFLRAREFGQYYLQVGGPTMQWRLIALPADDIRVTISGVEAAQTPDPADSAVYVSVVSTDHAGATLLNYLSEGGIGDAGIVGAMVADEVLQAKRSNPTLAAVAGYFLLTTRDLERLHQVCASNLADWMAWLPDGAVIDAWYRLRLAEPDLPRARQRMLEAAERGIPIFTRGLRLLLDGLASFDDDPDWTGPDVRAALQSVRRYAATADWRSRTTTFIGYDPDSPGKTAVGRPDDPTHIVFATAPMPDDVEWKNRSSRLRGAVFARPIAPAPAARLSDPTAAFRGPISRGAVGATVEAAAESMLAPEVRAQQLLMGELAESAATLQKPLADSIEKLSNEAESRYLARKTSHAEALGSSGSEGSQDVAKQQLVRARLVRAAAAQTETERLGSTIPVALLGKTQHPMYFRGTAIERISGDNTLVSVSYLDRGLAAARTVGRIWSCDTQGDLLGFATGFLVSPRLVLTNHHVLASLELAKTSLIEFDYHDGPGGRILATKRFPFDPETLFVSDKKLDFSLIALGRPWVTSEFGWNRLSVEEGIAIAGEYISLIMHPFGMPKQLSLRESRLIDLAEDVVHFEASDVPSASGAPVFNDQWELIGMHRAGIPERNEQGHIIATDGRLWTQQDDLSGVRWLAHEAVRANRIAAFLKRLELPKQPAELRDELLFTKPPAG